MRTNFFKKLIAALVCVIVLVSLVALRRGPPLQVARAHQGTQAAGPRVSWPENRRLTYSLSWHARTAGEIAPPSAGKADANMNLQATVEGEIALQRVGGTSSSPLVALSYRRFDKFSFGMQGEDSQAQIEQISKALAGQTAFLSIDDRGRISEISFPPEMDPSSRSVLRSLALQLGYTLPAGEEASWEADESNSLGEAHVRYRRGNGDFAREPIAFSKLDVVRGPLDGKQELRGGALISVDEQGLLLSIDETVDAVYTHVGSSTPAVRSGWTFLLSRTAVGLGDSKLAAVAQRAQVQPLRAQVEDPERDHRRDLRMANGMSTDALLLAFDRFERGTRPDKQFLVHAAAWLRLHPEALPMVLARFTAAELSVKGRGLILDVLAETGNAKAQETMRAALAAPQSHATPLDFSTLVQRFTFVLAPDAASIKFLEESYDASKKSGDVYSAQGTVVALGSAVRRLTTQHETSEADQVNSLLRAELHAAPTPEMRAALVAALGNAARPEDVADIVAIAGDPSSRVRDQVAAALANVDSPDARQALFALVTDRSSGVASAALDALHSQTLGDSDWQSLEQIAQRASSPLTTDAAMLNLVREKDTTIDRPESRQILTALLDRNQGGDNDLPGIIRGLLNPAN